MLVARWESSREFTSKEATLRTESKVLQVSRPVGQLERTAMKKAVEATYGKMAPKVTPDADYLSSKLEEVEQDEPQRKRRRRSCSQRSSFQQRKARDPSPDARRQNDLLPLQQRHLQIQEVQLPSRLQDQRMRTGASYGQARGLVKGGGLC